ncbi:hypothetical protein, partial [Stieleria sp.]|uniref:hypothetical protein n=1 Tax=Stieleria sp. TaxID=2795976 RepID=UPI003569E6FD
TTGYVIRKVTRSRGLVASSTTGYLEHKVTRSEGLVASSTTGYLERKQQFYRATCSTSHTITAA